MSKEVKEMEMENLKGKASDAEQNQEIERTSVLSPKKTVGKKEYNKPNNPFRKNSTSSNSSRLEFSGSGTSRLSRTSISSSSGSESRISRDRFSSTRHGTQDQKAKLKVRSRSMSKSNFRGRSKLRSSSGADSGSNSGSHSGNNSASNSSSGSRSDLRSDSETAPGFDSGSNAGASSRGSDKKETTSRLRSAVRRINETWQSPNSFKSVKTYRKKYESRSRSSSSSTPQNRFNPWKNRIDLTNGSTEPKSPDNRSRNPWRIGMRNRRKTQSKGSSCSPYQKVFKNGSLIRSRSPHRNPWRDRSPPKSRSPPNNLNTRKQPKDVVDNDTDLYRERHKITLASWDIRPIPKPMKSFHSSGFDATILRRLELQGFDAPTPIQAQTWSIALAGRNLVMISGNGTGKTLGYLLPGILNAQEQRGSKRRKKGPIVLVLVDGREAATLVHKEVLNYTNPRELRAHCLLGSGQWQSHSECDLLVASAGRLLEMIDDKKHEVELDRCVYLVLDDVDRMIDVGLEGQICRLLCRLRPRAQLIITTSSWTRNLERLSNKFMGQYTSIRVGQINNSSEGLQNIRQRVEVIDGRSKMYQLKDELTAIYDLSDSPGKVVVYVKRQMLVDELVNFIRLFVPCEGIHGGRSTVEKEVIIRDFRNGAYNIIVATDMTSRGLDVPGIRYVINYDFPNSIEGYVQRLVRTGCLSRSRNCEAISFFTKANSKLLMDVVDFLKNNKQEIQPHLLQMAEERARRPRNRKRHRPQRYNRKR
ncbi:putative ATP-dependent RNA helicase CG14443 [Drosophila teissieri]|uniref:putative ATP-dependent RNA helicase CG14443 n=1 Tax=Drosophila teissieri TaxID=7243 RepID=UPI001CB9F635|nr:putative ATP-dependent RNA helicase CG14443 [Drosophila teissieri]